MTTYTAYAFGTNLAYLIVAVLATYGAIRFLNWHNGVKFSEHVHAKIGTDPVALALYYGLRWIALGIIAAALLR